MYYLADFSKLNQPEQPKKESELKKWGRAGALMATGGLVVPTGGFIGLQAGNIFANRVSGLKKAEDKFDKLNRKIGSRYVETLEDGTRKKISKGSYVDNEVLLPRHKKALDKGYKILDKVDNKAKKIRSKAITTGALLGGALAGAGTYGAYRAGKSIYNRVLKRGKNNDKK